MHGAILMRVGEYEDAREQLKKALASGVAMAADTETWFRRFPSMTISGFSDADPTTSVNFRAVTDAGFQSLALKGVQSGESFLVSSNGRHVGWDGASPFDFSAFGSNVTEFSIRGNGFTSLSGLRDVGITFDTGGTQASNVCVSNAGHAVLEPSYAYRSHAAFVIRSSCMTRRRSPAWSDFTDISPRLANDAFRELGLN
jgi:hypothetical protein